MKDIFWWYGLGTMDLPAYGGKGARYCRYGHLGVTYGFTANAAANKAKGVDNIACLSVNAAYVMAAWGKDLNVGDDVTMLADGNGDFTRAVGLGFDGSGYGLGERSQRYAMIVDDGTITTLAVEDGPGLDVSSAEAMLAKL